MGSGTRYHGSGKLPAGSKVRCIQPTMLIKEDIEYTVVREFITAIKLKGYPHRYLKFRFIKVGDEHMGEGYLDDNEIEGEEIEEGEEVVEAELVNFGEVKNANYGVAVLFSTDPNRLYHFICDIPNINVGDYVVVEDLRHDHMDLVIGKVHATSETPDQRCTKYILNKVDDNGYLEQKRLKKEYADLEKRARERAKTLAERQSYEKLLAEDEEGNEILKALKDLRQRLGA